MLFKYEAYNKEKKLVRGTLESPTSEQAEGILYRAGLERITNLKESGPVLDWDKLLHGPPRVSKQGLLDFNNELAIMLESDSVCKPL